MARALVLGGSGGVGRHVLRALLARGHEVRAVVRSGSERNVPGTIEVVRGDVTDPLVIEGAMRGRDLVISSLGFQRANPRNPWSALTSPPSFNSTTARSIVAAMRKYDVPRILAVSAAGVADSAPTMNLVMRFLVARSNIGVAYRDLALMERVYAESGLDWHAPRPVTLTDGPETSAIAVVDGFSLTATISRADVARWLVDRAEDGRLEPRTPIIAHAKRS